MRPKAQDMLVLFSSKSPHPSPGRCLHWNMNTLGYLGLTLKNWAPNSKNKVWVQIVWGSSPLLGSE